MMNWNEISQRIFSLYAGKTQTEIGLALGVSQDTISRWATGKAKPGWEHIAKVSADKGKSEEWILLGDMNAPTPKEVEASDDAKRLVIELLRLQEEIAVISRGLLAAEFADADRIEAALQGPLQRIRDVIAHAKVAADVPGRDSQVS